MAIHPRARAPSHPTSPLERLVEERGLRRYAFFLVTGEGSYLPNGDEEKSGYVVGEGGRVYSFWTGWDALRDDVVFAEWKHIVPDAEWLDEPEFRRACAAVEAPPRQAHGVDVVVEQPGNRVAAIEDAIVLIAARVTRQLAAFLGTLRSQLGSRLRR